MSGQTPQLRFRLHAAHSHAPTPRTRHTHRRFNRRRGGARLARRHSHAARPAHTHTLGPPGTRLPPRECGRGRAQRTRRTRATHATLSRLSDGLTKAVSILTAQHTRRCLALSLSSFSGIHQPHVQRTRRWAMKRYGHEKKFSLERVALWVRVGWPCQSCVGDGVGGRVCTGCVSVRVGIFVRSE